MFLTTIGFAVPCKAMALQIQPTQYKAALKSGERQRGFVDVGNPTSQTVTVNFSVQAFRQIDDKGSLQFYDDEQVRAGIQLDLSSVDLAPGEAVRLYFLADGSKLPSGDVFAAIFATTQPPDGQAGVSPAVRVGALLSITNGTPGSRTAIIDHVAAGFWQFDTTIRGSYDIRNTAKEGTATGFYPNVTVSLTPLQTTQTTTGSLIMAGRTRQNNFRLITERFGLYRLTVRYGNNERSVWVFVVSGVWRWVLVALGAILTGLGVLGWRRWRQRR